MVTNDAWIRLRKDERMLLLNELKRIGLGVLAGRRAKWGLLLSSHSTGKGTGGESVMSTLGKAGISGPKKREGSSRTGKTIALCLRKKKNTRKAAEHTRAEG